MRIPIARHRLVRLLGAALLAAATASLWLGPAPAFAAESPPPGITIDIPADQEVISRGATPTLVVGGTTAFATAQPDERTFYVASTCDVKYLSVHKGPGGLACAWQGSITPLGELAGWRTTNVYPTFDTAEGVPFTLDASRPLAGVVTVGSLYCDGPQACGLGVTTIDVTVSADVWDRSGGTLYRTEHVLGQAKIEYIATPLQRVYRNPWQIDVPDELDKKDVSKLILELDVHGYNVLHGFTFPNDTYLTVPIYTASFERRVEVALDASPFTDEGITLGENGTTWTTMIQTPAVGDHTIRARAVQGLRWSRTAEGWGMAPRGSPVVARTFTVVE